MKTTVPSLRSWRQILPGSALAVLLAVGSTCQLVAQMPSTPASPVGTWDFVISGNQQGVAFLTFSNDSTGTGGSISGFEVITYQVRFPTPTPPASPDPRNIAWADPGRTGGGSHSATNASDTTSSQITKYLFGYTPISGQWNFDERGKTIGFFTEDSFGDAELARSASFRATVLRPGKRMVLSVVQSPDPSQVGTKIARMVYSGVPFATVAPDLGGSWYGTGSLRSTHAFAQSFTEFFTLTNLSMAVENYPAIFDDIPMFSYFTNIVDSPAASNTFLLTGAGPGYTSIGLALVSKQNRMSVVSQNTSAVDSNSILRAVQGTLNVRKGTAIMNGTDDNTSRVNYRAKKY